MTVPITSDLAGYQAFWVEMRGTAIKVLLLIFVAHCAWDYILKRWL